MLDVVFINLISAGLAELCAPAAGANERAGRPVDSAAIIRHLSLDAPAPTSELITRSVEALWQSCKAVGLPSEIAEPHLAALTAALHDTGFTAADRRVLLGPPGVSSSTEIDPGPVPGPDLAPDPAHDAGRKAISARIAAAGAATSSLDQTIFYYLLEALLKCFAANRHLIAAIEPVLLSHLSPTPPPSPKSTTALAKIERAAALGISVPLLEIITVSLINRTKSSDLRHADLLAAAADTLHLAHQLCELDAQDVASPPATLPEVLALFHAGRLDECDQLLAAIEDRVVKRSISVSPPDIRFARTAIEIRLIRAGLPALTGRFVKAARHYGFALRYLPRTAHELRWHYAEREAHYYELAALSNGAVDGLELAARALTSALAVIPAEPDAQTRAIAETGLARILLLLGEQEREPARFELAAQLLAVAQSALAANTADADYIRATILRADALTRLGETHQSRDLLEQAAFLYQSAIEAAAAWARATPSATLPELAVGLNARMALTLCALADITGDQVTRDAAVTIIIDELPELLAPDAAWETSVTATGYSRCLLVARCHIGLAHWHLGRGDRAPGAVHYERAAKEFDNIGMHDTARAVRLRASGAAIITDDQQPPAVPPHGPAASSAATAA